MNSNKNIMAILILSAVILLLCILCVTLVYDNKNENSINNITPSYNSNELSTEKPIKQTTPINAPTEPSTNPTVENIIEITEPKIIDIEITAPSAQITTQIITEPKSEKIPTEPKTESPNDKLTQLIFNSGYTLDDIEAEKIEQLIIVTDSKASVNAYMFSFTNNTWKDEEIECEAYVGSNGIGKKESDHDNITPNGLYSIGEAFYTDIKPSTWLSTFVITENTYWITDAQSEMYNKKVEIEEGNNRNGAVHMIESDSYKYGCVINYNTNPITAGKGSAVFLQCGTKATNASIALAESNLLKFLEILNSEKNPHILIF